MEQAKRNYRSSSSKLLLGWREESKCPIPGIMLQAQCFPSLITGTIPDVIVELVSKTHHLSWEGPPFCLSRSIILFTAFYFRFDSPLNPFFQSWNYTTWLQEKGSREFSELPLTYWLLQNKHYFTKPFHEQHLILSSNQPGEVREQVLSFPFY